MPTYRVVSLLKSGKFQEKDYGNTSELCDRFEQVGVEEDTYCLRLHGQPVFKGLIGPLNDGPSAIRYETPEAYAVLTEVWAKTRRPRRRRTVEDDE